MIDFVRSLPISAFIWTNPVLWLLAFWPPIVFWARREKPGPDGIGWSIVLVSLGGWVLAIFCVLGTDWLVWQFAEAKDPIPPHWESYLFGDGARDVFVIFFGWAFGLVIAVAWSPLILCAYLIRWVRQRQVNRPEEPAA